MKAGILIIGSLLWDKKEYKNPQYCRESWRKERLNVDDRTPVDVPILYGRTASTRGDTYTMIFSPTQGGGTAQVVDCKKEIKNAGDLIAEATALWAAESKGKNTKGRISAEQGWGCTALLVRDRTNFPEAILRGWQQRIATEKYKGIADYKVGNAADAPLIVGPDGFLNIAWPTAANKFDLLLATATEPKPTERPTAAKIAELWWNDKLANFDYFIENRQNSIRTADDENIIAELTSRLENL